MIQPNPGVSVRCGRRLPRQGSLILAIAPVYEALGYASLPVCVAKTHLSPSHRTMPGVPSHPAGEKIDIDADGNVVGLF